MNAYNQEMEILLRQLQSKSSYTRERVSRYHEILRTGNEIFSIDLLTSHDEQKLKQTFEFLSGFFEQGMDDYEHMIDEWIFDLDIAYHALGDGSGNVVGAANSSLLHLESGCENAESVLAVWYVAIDPKYRGRRLPNELYQSIYQFSLERIQTERKELKAIVGEASHKEIKTIERVLSRDEIARKRVYYQDNDEVLREVPYVSPPLRWDFETGEPAEEAQANHLMLRLLNGEQHMPAKDLLTIIKAIYHDSYLPRQDDFLNNESYMKAGVTVDNYLRSIEAALAEAKNGEIFLK